MQIEQRFAGNIDQNDQDYEDDSKGESSLKSGQKRLRIRKAIEPIEFNDAGSSQDELGQIDEKSYNSDDVCTIEFDEGQTHI